jgi:hypothetical protein
MAQIASAGISDVRASTLASWRRAKLLDKVHQTTTGGGGSVVFHPPDTAARVVAIRALQAERDDLEWIGAQLWWRYGFPVAESHWRPRLIETAQALDPVLSALATLVAKEISEDDDDLEEKPLADEVADHLRPPNIIMSRILRRVPADEITPMLRLIIHTAGGEPPDYEPNTAEEPEPRDKTQLVRALDFEGSKRDAVAGQRFQFAEAIGPALGEIARALRAGTLTDAANADRREIEAARDDLRRGFEIASGLYRSMKWVYGDEAFGLRFADWIGRKAPPEMVRLMLLGFVLLRRTESTLLSSAEIADLHHATFQIFNLSDELRRLHEDNPASKYLHPSYIKSVFSGRISFHDLKAELESIRS